eukprot:scaffold26174_cov80-Attheya_sp.AAC.1
MPLKYTVEVGITFQRNSLGITESQLSIRYDSLEISSLSIIPPHSRIPKGRSRKKHLTTQSHSHHIAIHNRIAIDNTQHTERSSGVVNHTANAQDDTQVSEALPSDNCSYFINDDATYIGKS